MKERRNMSATAAAIDYDHLKIQAAEDLDVMREVLQLFVEHTEQVLNDLEKANDEKAWKQLVHTLKGSARGVGAFALADAAARAERSILDKAHLAPLRSAFVDAQKFIAQNPM